MTHTVRFRLDPSAESEINDLRRRLLLAGLHVPSDIPTVALAAAAQIPAAARVELTEALRGLSLPSIWLSMAGVLAGRDDDLVLAAVVDTELLAVHNTVHDALAGRVRGPLASYLPGGWLPHCTLAHEQPVRAMSLLHPLRAVRATVIGVEIGDTCDGTSEPLFA